MSPEQNPLELLKSGTAPRNVRLAAAKGLVPMPIGELVATLIRLTGDPDRIVNNEANSSLNAIGEDRLLPLLKSQTATPELLKYFCFDPTRGPTVLEAVVMNNATPDLTIAELALVTETAVLETILFNQVRLLRSPKILHNILENRNSNAEIQRRCHEMLEAFFPKTAPSADDAPPVEKDDSPNLVDAEIPTPETLGLEVEQPHDPQEMGLQTAQEISTFHRIALLNTSEKVRLALLGSREERTILIRDANRIVASMVLKSPKLTEQEVETISKMRNVSEDVLRTICARREWIRSYTIIHNLVRNPKTPVAASLGLLPRIITTDLRLLTRDRSVPELLRRHAEKTLRSRKAVF